MKTQLLSEHIGVEISGVQLDNLDEAELAAIKKAWLDHKVLVFRNQQISTEAHIAFGKYFGELEIHPFADNLEEYPEIIVLEAGGDSPRQNYNAAKDWHIDVSFREKPPMGSILRGKVIPETGGDTRFSNAAAAYDNLDPGVKSRVDDLFAVNDYTKMFGPTTRFNSEESHQENIKDYPPVLHPVIRTHPETGQKSIFTNNFFTSHIDGVDDEESEMLLGALAEAIRDPSVQFRVQWEPDTFVMWDNRCVHHVAMDDFLPLFRRMERVTIAGDRPY
ncbi:MAG: taurine dioxygenase [Acidimicrobiaceae bacterium]|nr:taurine dioxygenase [Acidimicrobiaceae bacterium]|tara:strand:+ start:1090 stop:1917 length:828 start_codon:yes stop_codon:yes gene_type:complete